MEISELLLDKYNKPVPRYTSYPPANHFETFSEENYFDLVKMSTTDGSQNIAIYIHIPFCKKICLYCGCNACAIGTGTMVKPYMEALKKELVMFVENTDSNRCISQIHYGGGTPNALDANTLKELNDFIFENFNLIEFPEIAIECNPAYLDYDYIDVLKTAGFNRFSLGIQDFDNKILSQVNREPSKIAVEQLIEYIKKDRPDISVNLDFIYGLPGQTVASFSDTIAKAALLRPDRLVTFSYAHVPWVKGHQKILESRGLPDANKKMEMFLAAFEILSEAGYVSIGLDHYVLPDDELNIAFKNHQLHRNFQGYCTKRTTGDVYAFGVSSITQLEKGYAQNLKEIDAYIDAVNRNEHPVEKGYILSDSQLITRSIIVELMCNMKVDWIEMADRLNFPLETILANVNLESENLNEFVIDDLLIISAHCIEVTKKGSLFVRNIAAALDKEFTQKGFTYSKSV